MERQLRAFLWASGNAPLERHNITYHRHTAFALDESANQPSGTCNMSRIDLEPHTVRVRVEPEPEPEDTYRLHPVDPVANPAMRKLEAREICPGGKYHAKAGGGAKAKRAGAEGGSRHHQSKGHKGK